MSTRAIYTFIEPEHTDSKRGYHVYKHHDGYPSGAVQWIKAALDHAWPLPRFEADDFAAAFVAANKNADQRELKLLRELEQCDDMRERRLKKEGLEAQRRHRSQGGGVRLMPSGSVYAVAPMDIEYRYEITLGAKSTLWVKAFETNFWGTRTAANEKLIFEGTLEAMEAWANAPEDTGPRPLHEIAREISADWKRPYFGAVPYLRAMHDLTYASSCYGSDDAKSIVAYFLANAKTWRGDVAKRVKAELKAMIA